MSWFGCPFCEHVTKCKTVNVRPSPEKHAIYRRRICETCGERFTTYETVSGALLEKLALKKKG